MWRVLDSLFSLGVGLLDRVHESIPSTAESDDDPPRVSPHPRNSRTCRLNMLIFSERFSKTFQQMLFVRNLLNSANLPHAPNLVSSMKDHGQTKLVSQIASTRAIAEARRHRAAPRPLEEATRIKSGVGSRSSPSWKGLSR